jgi:hypothetical protein
MSPTDNSTPKATAITFLKGIKLRNKEQMRSVCHPDATACLIRQRKPIYLLVANVLDRISDDSGVAMDEVSFDQIEHVDSDFATVWTPYKFYEDGEVSRRRWLELGHLPEIATAPSYWHEQFYALEVARQRLAYHRRSGCFKAGRRSHELLDRWRTRH